MHTNILCKNNKEEIRYRISKMAKFVPAIHNIIE